MAKATPKTKSAALNMRIDPALLKKLKAAAAKEDRSVSWMVSHFIDRGLAKS